MADKQEEIKKATIEEILISFYNGHLRDFLTAAVRLRVAKDSEPNQVIGYEPRPPLGPNQQPIIVEVRAKDLIGRSENDLNLNAQFLRAVEERLEEYKKNQTPWRTTQK